VATLGGWDAIAAPSPANDDRTFEVVLAELQHSPSSAVEVKDLKRLESLIDPRSVPELEKLLEEKSRGHKVRIRLLVAKLKLYQLKDDKEKISFLRSSANGTGAVAQWALDESFQLRRRNLDFLTVLSDVAANRNNKNWAYAKALLKDAERGGHD